MVGMGKAGSLHAEIFRSEIQEATLRCVIDEREELAKELGRKLQVDSAIDYEEALDRRDVQAVVVSVPTNLHSVVALSSLNAGKNVLVEKPLARSLEEAKGIVRKTEESGLIAQVGYMRRFDEYYLEAKKRIQQAYLGKAILYRAIAHDPSPPQGWAADPSLSGGIFYDMLSHDFDMARNMLDSEVTSAYARGSSLLSTEIGEKGDYDVASVLLTFDSAAHGYVEGIRKSNYGYDLRTEIVGSDATIQVGDISDTMLTFADQEGIRHGGRQWFMRRFRNAFVEEDRSFIRSILNRSQPLVSVLDGLRAVEIAEACKLSASRGVPITVDAVQ